MSGGQEEEIVAMSVSITRGAALVTVPFLPGEGKGRFICLEGFVSLEFSGIFMRHLEKAGCVTGACV